MKLIITGSTGYVATEVLRQAMSHPSITSVIAVARRPVTAPPDATDPAKLQVVVVKDYDDYPVEARAAFKGASACIWTVAVTPNKAKAMDPEDVRRVCQDYTMAGLKAMHASSPARPFRFLYMSGIVSERDQQKGLWFWQGYRRMRGEGENQVLKYAADHEGEVEGAIARLGYIPRERNLGNTVLAGISLVTGMDAEGVTLGHLASAMIEQAINGFEKDCLLPSDLNRIAKGAHERTGK